eukprot:gene2487-18150_t
MQSLRFDEFEDAVGEDEDPFSTKVMTFEQGGGEFTPVLIGRKALKNLNRNEVFIKRWPEPLRYQYYKNIIPDVSIKMCQSCFRMFHTEDFELALLQHGHCPFCRFKFD